MSDLDSPTAATLSPAEASKVRRLRQLGRFMDSSIRLPGGYRIGWDGIIGLIPGVGDLIGLIVSGGIVVSTARLGVPRIVLARMLGNVALETIIGAVPLLGDVFDFVFKANERNLALAFRALESPQRVKRRTAAGFAVIAAVGLGVVVLIGWAVVAVVAALLGLLFG